MDQNVLTKVTSTGNTEKEKKPLCAWSIIAFVVSLAAFGAYCLVLGPSINALIPLWEVLSVVSVFLPAIAKKTRISRKQSGRGLEIAAIVIGGFTFYSVMFVMTKLSIYVGYLGWIVGGLLYKFIGRESK